jgi:hypothetical protein
VAKSRFRTATHAVPPQHVQPEDVPDPDGMNGWVGILASLVTRPSQTRSRDPATHYPSLPSRTTPAAARRTLDLDAAHRGLKPPGRWTTCPA